MNIDKELYDNNPFYRQLVEQLCENERKRQELENGINNLRQEMVCYANQLPYHTMTQVSPYTWRAPYATFENNYANYWANRYPSSCQQYEQEYRRNFKTAVDKAAYITKETNPVASIVFDSLGLMTPNSLIDVLAKTLSIIDTAQKL